MKKYNRRALSLTRGELADLLTVKDPNPFELPKEVVVLLRRARRHCGAIVKFLPWHGFECVAMQCDNFADEIDELLQKYNCSIPFNGFDYWEWEWEWQRQADD